jgi:hypothetical protein
MARFCANADPNTTFFKDIGILKLKEIQTLFFQKNSFFQTSSSRSRPQSKVKYYF